MRVASLVLSTLFQFHKGTIKTTVLKQKLADSLQFQFHKGTIKTFPDAEKAFVDYLNFNSIKVRLKPPKSSYLGNESISFQFHKGTIKTG